MFTFLSTPKVVLGQVFQNIRVPFWPMFSATALVVLFAAPLSARTVPMLISIEFKPGGSCSAYELTNAQFQAVEMADEVINTMSNYKYYAEQGHRHYRSGVVRIMGGGTNNAFETASDASYAIDYMNKAVFGDKNPQLGTTANYLHPNSMKHQGDCAPVGIPECWAAWLSTVAQAKEDTSFALPYGYCSATVPPFELVCETVLRDVNVDFGQIKVGSEGHKTQRVDISCNSSAYYNLSVVGSADGKLTYDEGHLVITSDGQPLPLKGEIQGQTGGAETFVGLDLDATFEQAGEVEWTVKLLVNFE
ncbi:hypothetical protein [Shewanella algae]|uniref:hypothetical protein n=1 Tax=Shewanella algae TaxID=38313 RepID=UPI000F427467|nr:hypothetical protein [Shewanella algae]AYV13684.1 hypothetical protein EEY24_12800 [Shewanella algae]